MQALRGIDHAPRPRGRQRRAPPSVPGAAGWAHRALVVLGLVAAFSAAAAPPALPALGAAREITLSGLSSGGYAAAQFAVVHGKDVRGIGVIAGGPYDCAMGDLAEAMTRCACTGDRCAATTPSVLATRSALRARGKASLGRIDRLDALKRQRVWLFSGGVDDTVPAANVKALRDFYVEGMGTPAAQVHLEHRPEAGHGLPVDDAPGAGACGVSAPPFINDCDFDAAGQLLGWLLPGTVHKTPAAGELLAFDQRPYLRGLAWTGLANEGFVYVPASCRAGRSAGCRVHVVFHGCRQASLSDDGSGGTVGRSFVERAGFNAWAASSRLIVLYPQVMPHDTGLPLPYRLNPRACWDFWGYTSRTPWAGTQVTHEAPQIRAVRAMVRALQR